MAKVLVTGASGFIGRHLVPTLCAAGHAVIEGTSASGDIGQESTWASLSQGRRRRPPGWEDLRARQLVRAGGSFSRCNLMGTIGALNYCRTHGSTPGLPEFVPVTAITRALPSTGNRAPGGDQSICVVEEAGGGGVCVFCRQLWRRHHRSSAVQRVRPRAGNAFSNPVGSSTDRRWCGHPCEGSGTETGLCVCQRSD